MTANSSNFPSGEELEPVSERDQQLAELVNHVADQLRAGKRPDIESLLRDHADMADELRGLWTTMLVYCVIIV
jgi:hypothetical protein